MFALAYAILPDTSAPPAEALRASLARFQRGGPGDVPEDWLAFHDETPGLRDAHEAAFTFEMLDTGGLRFGGLPNAHWYLDSTKIVGEMRRQDTRHWSVRFADTIDLDAFATHYAVTLARHSVTGDYGQWLNPLGRWDWWDLGGRFDDRIVGDPRRGEGRGTAVISSGESRGRTVLANIARTFEDALDQEPPPAFDVRSDRNVELVATLLADLRAGRDSARPGALVRPPGSLEDRFRWFRTWPSLDLLDALPVLGLAHDADWLAVVDAVYTRFQDHWAAAIAFHL